MPVIRAPVQEKQQGCCKYRSGSQSESQSGSGRNRNPIGIAIGIGIGIQSGSASDALLESDSESCPAERGVPKGRRENSRG